MTIGNVIRKYRKSLGMTQEEVAERLGVTSPAVSKWENNTTVPDISLLAPLARLLGITTDTLLSYRNSLTGEEISSFVAELNRKLEEGPYSEAFSFAREKIQEYPNCEKLIWSLAVMLDAREKMAPADSCRGMADETDYDAQIGSWYVRALQSGDYTTKKAAANSLCSFYMRKGQYENARECLQYFPEDDPERKRWDALLNSRTGRKEEACKAYESLLLSGYNNLKMAITGLRILYMKDGDYPMAHKLTDLERSLAVLFERGAYEEAAAGLELATLEKNVEETERIMRTILLDYDTLMDFTRSDLYRHICPSPKPVPASAERMKRTIAAGFLAEDTYGYMKGNAFWEKLKKQVSPLL